MDIKIFSKECKFITSMLSYKPAPLPNLPEFVFFGRSNVGKSSLINSLLNRRKLALVSSTPGKTRMLNFFELEQILLLVDVPGYGYAKVSKEQHSQWEKMILSYLDRSQNIATIFLLIDARRDLQDSDHALLDLLNGMDVNYHLIFTKTDKLNISEINILKQKMLQLFGAENQYILTSIKSKQGIEELQNLILTLI